MCVGGSFNLIGGFIHRIFNQIDIAVGLNTENIKLIHADILTSSSTILKAKNPNLAIHLLMGSDEFDKYNFYLKASTYKLTIGLLSNFIVRIVSNLDPLYVDFNTFINFASLRKNFIL